MLGTGYSETAAKKNLTGFKRQQFVILILQNIRTSLAKKNQQVFISGVRPHFRKHLDMIINV